ncbi:MAG: molybdenum cofactor guanylyltransferase [Bacteroidales bacterium]|nr:molybdenum cofactor guanylyltransferase [Bacteroidales bacterium]
MKTNKEEVTGIILAGGKSSRMGKDKGLCDFNGKALVSYAIETLKPLCGTLMISANYFPEKYTEYGLPVVADDVKNIGPMGGILTCLRKSQTQHNLVLSCDTPFVTTKVFQKLLDAVEKDQVVAPVHHTFLLEPLSAYYNTNVINDMEHAIKSGNYKMMDFMKSVRFKSLDIEHLPFFSEYLFLNLNSPQDMEKAQKLGL